MTHDLLGLFFANHFAAITTLVFVSGLILFAVLIIQRYRKLDRVLDTHIQTVNTVIAFIEHKREPVLKNPDLVANFNDYRAVLLDSHDESECFIKFKRKNLEILTGVVPVVEFCRTATESLPFIGILGTVCGFMLTPDILQGHFSATSSGLILALSSTGTALFFTVLIKLGYESKTMPMYLQLESALQAIESYGEHYGAIHRAIHPAQTPHPPAGA